MGLVQNGYRLGFGPFQRRIGALTTIYNGGGDLFTFRTMPGVLRGNYGRYGAYASLPSGCRHPHSWLQPQKAGALSSRNNLTGTGTITTDVWAVRLAEADLTGDGGVSSAVGGLIVQLVAAISGSGTISAADLQAFLAAVAALTGSGGISSAQATGFGELAAALSGDGTANGSVLTAIGELSADLKAYGDLTNEGLRDAVWAKIIEAGYTAEQILRLLAAHAAGAATGLEGSDMQYTGLDGTTVRIDGNYSGGTRTIDSLDAE